MVQSHLPVESIKLAGHAERRDCAHTAGQIEWVQLRARLLDEVDTAHDSLRFCFPDEKAVAPTGLHGVREPIDPGVEYWTRMLDAPSR